MMLTNILPLNHKNFVNTRKGRKTLSSWVSEGKGIDSKYELQEEMMLSKSWNICFLTPVFASIFVLTGSLAKHIFMDLDVHSAEWHQHGCARDEQSNQ